ncbi:MAG: Rid family detoxifying hydrolase [Desulfurococcales archaeon]|nr:Rid family detoxifying hydrolase [Desulfurococcales archaeon]
MKEGIFTDKAPKPVGPYSQGIKLGNLIFVSGQIPINPETGEIIREPFEAAARQALSNMIEIVKAGGGDIDTILQVRVYLKDVGKFGVFNKVYSDYFGNTLPPARVVIEASKLPLDVDLEVECIAYAPE